MNSASAELLQLLTFAALQPSGPPFAYSRQATRKNLVLAVECGRVFSSSVPLRIDVSVSFLKKKPPGPDSIQARRSVKNVEFLCILVRALYPILLIVLRVHPVQKTFCDNSRKFKFVKYTKTLLKRNLHDTISHAFFRYKRCIARYQGKTASGLEKNMRAIAAHKVSPAQISAALNRYSAHSPVTQKALWHKARFKIRRHRAMPVKTVFAMHVDAQTQTARALRAMCGGCCAPAARALKEKAR